MVYRYILFAFSLVLFTLILWAGIDVFLLIFATILLAILLHSIGTGTQKLIRLPYVLSLAIGLSVITGILVLIFTLYSPLIAKQFELLVAELPEGAAGLKTTLAPHLNFDFLPSGSVEKGLTLFNETFFKQVLTIFSGTISSIVSFIIFLIIGFYLAVSPEYYVRGAQFMIPKKSQKRVWDVVTNIHHSLKFWLLGKVLSMIAIGILTFIGLWSLNISLAAILGILAGLLAFIPYVGSIIASIPAILIAFTNSPISAVYVIILYLGIHILDGYLITPYIEQKTVSVPPALTIASQILLYTLIGGLGLALVTPLIVVFMSLIVSLKSTKRTHC